MPNGKTVLITLPDLYHVIVDDRIRRKPERIELALRHVVELRRSRDARRQALSRWQESDSERLAEVVIEGGSRLWLLHLIDERRLRRLIRHGGEALWRAYE